MVKQTTLVSTDENMLAFQDFVATIWQLRIYDYAFYFIVCSLINVAENGWEAVSGQNC